MKDTHYFQLAVGSLNSLRGHMHGPVPHCIPRPGITLEYDIPRSQTMSPYALVHRSTSWHDHMLEGDHGAIKSADGVKSAIFSIPGLIIASITTMAQQRWTFQTDLSEHIPGVTSDAEVKAGSLKAADWHPGARCINIV